MSNLLERALQTFWQAALAGGLVDVVAEPSWDALLVAVIVGVVGFALSAFKTWLQEKGVLPSPS